MLQARAAFVRNHPLQPPSDYEENFQNKALSEWLGLLYPTALETPWSGSVITVSPLFCAVEALNAKLADADKLIHSTGKHASSRL